MKKFIITFFLVLCTLPVMAENWILFRADAVERAINTIVTETRRTATASEYEKQMDKDTGKISVSGMFKVCAVAGFNINEPNGYEDCRRFVDFIAEASGFGSNSPTQQSCAAVFGGIWTITPDGKTYQCVGKDGHLLKHSASCRNGNGECVKVFNSLQTQVPVAKEFIYAYGKQKGVQLTCSNEPVKIYKVGSDYIKCSAGGIAYEFAFDDLNQDPNSTAVESENAAMCKMFGGKIVKTDDKYDEKIWQSCDVSQDVCVGPLHDLAIKIGHDVMYQGYCRLSRTVKKSSIIGLNTLPGVDSRKFYNIGAQVRVDIAKAQVEEYLHDIFPNEDYIHCNSWIKTLEDPTKLNPEYVMTCTVGHQQVDFLFHDLTEGMDYKAKSGAAAMDCVIVGGVHAGKQCRGLNEAECKAISDQVSGGTTWDVKAGQCVLNDARVASQIDNGIMIAGGVIITVGTLGFVGAPAAATLVAVGGSVAFDATFLGLERWQEINPHHRALQFMSDAKGCADNDCAYNVVKSHFARLNEIFDDLNTDEMDLVLAEMERLGEYLSDEELASAMNDSELRGEDKVLNASSWLLLAAGVFAIPEQAIARMAAKAPKLVAKLERVIPKLRYIKYLDDDLEKVLKTLFDGKYELVHVNSQYSGLKGDYWGIIVHSYSDGHAVANDLRRRGYHVASNIDADSNAFVAVSKDNIFEPWNNSETNWLIRTNISNMFVGYDFKMIDNSGGFYISSPKTSTYADGLANYMNQNPDVLALAIPIEGRSDGAKVVVSILRKDVEKLGYSILSDGTVETVAMKVDNNQFLKNLSYWRDKPIIKIGNTHGYIADVGYNSDRAIVIVSIGEKRIPFYVSSGAAGKIDVPTGKWEVFWGIGPDPEGWFNKGYVEQINNHYGSTELRDIAKALDDKLGDPRNNVHMMESYARQLYGGKGWVGGVDYREQDLKYLDRTAINERLVYPPQNSDDLGIWAVEGNSQDIGNYLKGLNWPSYY